MMAEASSNKNSPPQIIDINNDVNESEEKNLSSSSTSTSSTPPWLRWSRGLHSLLDDVEGVELFEIYLSQEGCSAQLNFLWACEGLKSTGLDDPPKIPQLVRSIYRNLIQNSNLLGVSEDTRSNVAQGIKDGKFTTEIFDKAQEEVEIHMRDNLYPNFIKSEIYLSVANGELSTTSATTTTQDPQQQHELSESSSVSGVGGVGGVGGSGDSITERILSGVANKLQFDPLTGQVVQGVGGVGVCEAGEMSPRQISSPPSLSSFASAAAANNVLQMLPNQLQTVHEDRELSVNAPSNAPPGHNAKVKLTKEGLLATQRSRASTTNTVVPGAVGGAMVVGGNGKVRKGETISGHYYTNKSSQSAAPFPYHVMYSSYNPVSRVDSEIQSMSSDAMTDDGGHAAASAHHHHSSSSSKKHAHHHHKNQQEQQKHSQLPPSIRHMEKMSQYKGGVPIAAMGVQNRDNLPKYPVYERQLKNPNRDEMDPKAFALVLIKKLEEVKKNRDSEEKLNRRMLERDEGMSTTEELTPHLLAAAIREKLQVQEEGLPDDILDKHVSRIWKDITPDAMSPKLRSPTARRRTVLPPQIGAGALSRQKRDRLQDGISTLSGDSGNYNDYVPEVPSSPSLMFMPKSKSVPYELKSSDSGGESSQFPSSFQLQRGRCSRGGVGGRGLAQSDLKKMSGTMLTKKSSSEFLDSGISVMSGTAPPSGSALGTAFSYDWSKHTMVHQWVEQACHDEKPRARSTTSPNASRRQKKVGSVGVCSQSQGTPTPVLEEVCRRLKQKPPSYPTQHQQLPGTHPSTLPRRHHSQQQSQPQDDSFGGGGGISDYSVSSFVFYEDSEVPYGFKIPCKSRIGGVTLALFKEHLPKRGNFRFFFKRECEELDAKVVQEEVTDEFQILPLYEGKIIAHLQTASSCSSMVQQHTPLL